MAVAVAVALAAAAAVAVAVALGINQDGAKHLPTSLNKVLF